MLTRDEIQTDDQLMQYIEQAIGYAYRHVGKRRTERDDIARILYDHGARSSAVEIAVQDYVARQVPQATVDEQRVENARARLNALHDAGYVAEGKWAREKLPMRRGGAWDDLREAEREYADATAALAVRSETVDAAIARWWRDHETSVRALCYKHADLILKAGPRMGAGPGRPREREEPTRTISVRLSESVADALDAATDNKTAYIERLLRERLLPGDAE